GRSFAAKASQNKILDPMTIEIIETRSNALEKWLYKQSDANPQLMRKQLKPQATRILNTALKTSLLTFNARVNPWPGDVI
ncbi:MAG: hypothetical protein LW645_12280, partial [Verrucomicrobiaceae bacterium]|nr:hypothetical protein [Verrucomicrobiaceae bacterium]